MRLAFAVTTLLFCVQAVVDLGLPVPPFAVFVACRLLIAIVFSPVSSILNAHTLASLGGDRARFGEERLWGAISWAIANMILGVVMDHLGTWVMYIGTVVLGGCAVVLLSGSSGARKHQPLPDAAPGTEQDATPTDSKRPRGAVNISSGQLLKAYMTNPQSRSFFFAVFCLGVGMSLVENLLFLFFVEDLGASNALCGFSVVVTVAFEIPLLSHSKSLLERFGCRLLFSIGLVCYIVRVLGYTICPNGWCVVAFEPLHGVTFACCHLAAVQYVSSITPEEQLTTGQGVMCSIQQGLGYFVGTLGGGFVIQLFGEKVLYRGAASLVTLGLLVFRLQGMETPLVLEKRPAEVVEGEASVAIGKEASGRLEEDDTELANAAVPALGLAR